MAWLNPELSSLGSTSVQPHWCGKCALTACAARAPLEVPLQSPLLKLPVLYMGGTGWGRGRAGVRPNGNFRPWIQTSMWRHAKKHQLLLHCSPNRFPKFHDGMEEVCTGHRVWKVKTITGSVVEYGSGRNRNRK